VIVKPISMHGPEENIVSAVHVCRKVKAIATVY